MIQVFCKERGAGKTKELISLANERLNKTKGDSVYIDDDLKYERQVDRRIRFISIEDYKIKDCESFYGLLCGLVSANYDLENIYVDGFFNEVSFNQEELACLLKKVKLLAEKYNLNLYINISDEFEKVPDFIREYVA